MQDIELVLLDFRDGNAAGVGAYVDCGKFGHVRSSPLTLSYRRARRKPQVRQGHIQPRSRGLAIVVSVRLRIVSGLQVLTPSPQWPELGLLELFSRH